MFDVMAASEADLIDEIGRLERVKSAAAAGQARMTAVLAERRRAAEAAAGVPRAKQCRGLASEVGLARRDSPARGGRHLGFATALVFEMPHTLAALECGALSEWRATLIVRESACLSVEIGALWMPRYAPRSPISMDSAMRGSPRRPGRSPTGWPRRRWSIVRRSPSPSAP